MKVTTPTGKYIVTFNGSLWYGGEKVSIGDDSASSVDFVGDDITDLAVEVIADDPNYPLVFVPVEPKNGIVGIFCSPNSESAHGAAPFTEDCPDAVMYEAK